MPISTRCLDSIDNLAPLKLLAVAILIIVKETMQFVDYSATPGIKINSQIVDRIFRKSTIPQLINPIDKITDTVNS